MQYNYQICHIIDLVGQTQKWWLMWQSETMVDRRKTGMLEKYQELKKELERRREVKARVNPVVIGGSWDIVT